MASIVKPILRRALLYGTGTFISSHVQVEKIVLTNLPVPASSQKMLAKSLILASDNITYDLEDAVTPQQKPAARKALREHLAALSKPPAVGELAVRINAVSTPYALDDLTSLATAPVVDALVIPKVNSASDLSFVTDVLRHLAPERHPASASAQGGRPMRLIALIESARAVMDLRAICAASPYLSGLVFAAEDFALDMSLQRTPSLNEFSYARSAIATAARAFNLPSTIDLVCTSYKGPEALQRLRDECQNGREMGFNGKQCIHPSQVEMVQNMFSPAAEEVEWSVRVMIADKKASSQGRGAWTLEGNMIDAPVVGKAYAIVAKAETCGIDLRELREKWRCQEPE